MVTKKRAVVDARLEDLRVKVAARLLSNYSDYAPSCRGCGGCGGSPAPDTRRRPPPRVNDPEGRRSPHPFIAWIPLACAFLLPLLISLLLFLLLGTSLLPVLPLFLIYLLLVWGGLVDVWPARVRHRGRGYIGQRSHCRKEV